MLSIMQSTACPGAYGVARTGVGTSAKGVVATGAISVDAKARKDKARAPRCARAIAANLGSKFRVKIASSADFS